MAQISRLSRLVAGAQRGVDLASNTLVVSDLQVGGLSGTTLSKAQLDALLVISSDLASTASGKGASLVGIHDTAAQFTATDVEGALAESLDAAQAAQADATSALSAAAAAQSTANAAIPAAEKGANNGVASLDGGGKVPVSQLPNSIMEYQGTFDPTGPTPALADGTGNTGDVYKVTVAGAYDFGSGSITFVVGDYAIYNGTIWEKAHSGADAVVSVFGRSGVVTAQSGDYTTTQVTEGTNLYYTNARFDTRLGTKSTSDLAEGSNLYYTAARFNTAFSAKSTTDLTEGSNLYYTVARFNTAFGTKTTTDLAEGSNLYFTDARAKAAAVVNSTAGSQTDQAPSVSSIKTYVDTAVAGVSTGVLAIAAVAGEAMAANTTFAVRWAISGETAGRLYKADDDATTTDKFHVVGIVKVGTALSAGDPCSLVMMGQSTQASSDSAFSSGDIGKPVFLNSAGAWSTTPSSTAGHSNTIIGYVKTTTIMDVRSVQTQGIN